MLISLIIITPNQFDYTIKDFINKVIILLLEPILYKMYAFFIPQLSSTDRLCICIKSYVG